MFMTHKQRTLRAQLRHAIYSRHQNKHKTQISQEWDTALHSTSNYVKMSLSSLKINWRLKHKNAS